MRHPAQLLFFALVVRPLVLIVLGLNVRRRELLPRSGPCILVANHNSHLDALVLMSLFPLRRIGTIRPAAAADYFLKNRLLRWFALDVMRILPLARDGKGATRDPLEPLCDALEQGETVLLFPEGTRGRPEELEEFKSGVAHLARRHPTVPVTPVFLRGLGKALPRGEALLVPFFCDVFVGESMLWSGTRPEFMRDLNRRILDLATESEPPEWE